MHCIYMILAPLFLLHNLTILGNKIARQLIKTDGKLIYYSKK